MTNSLKRAVNSFFASAIVYEQELSLHSLFDNKEIEDKTKI